MTIQYDPQKVTDWLTPLEKVYARQSRQLDTYHQQLRERDRQEEAATINLPEIASKLASFSSSIKQVVDARETNISSKVKSLYGSETIWKQPSYNTYAGEHRLDGVPFRKNFAGNGMVYDEARDAFISPQPYPSWILNETTCCWDAPVPMPEEDPEPAGRWIWDEEDQQWVVE